MKFVATKKGIITNFFSPLSFFAVFGSGIRDPGWVKTRIIFTPFISQTFDREDNVPGYDIQPGENVQLSLDPGGVVLEHAVPGSILPPPACQGLRAVRWQSFTQYLHETRFKD